MSIETTTTEAAAPPAPAQSEYHGLVRNLAQLRSGAERFLDEPVRLKSEQLAGYVELVAQDEVGRIWISGWMTAAAPTEASVVIIDKGKFAGAVALTRFDRDDLDAGASGVVGVLHTDWAPTLFSAEVFLSFCDEERRFLRTVPPVKAVPLRRVAEVMENNRGRCYGGRADALARMLTSVESWVPGAAALGGFASHVSVDRVIAVPGFGCVAEGWAVSPVKDVSGFALKASDVVLRADPAATFRKPRPDLLAAFPHLAGLLPRAGFVTVFPWPGGTDAPAAPVLKVEYADGTSTNHEVQPDAVLRLQAGIGEQELLHCYPALEHEPFFPALAAAYQAASAPRPDALSVLRLRPAERAVVRALGADASDCYRVFHELLRDADLIRSAGAGVVLAANRALRGDVLPLLHEFEEEAGVPCTLLLLDGVPQAGDLLLDILDTVSAERFVFVAADVAASRAAVRQCLDALCTGGGAPLVFREPGDRFHAAEEAAILCLAWSRAEARDAVAAATDGAGCGTLRRGGMLAALAAHGSPRLREGTGMARTRLPEPLPPLMRRLLKAARKEAPVAGR